MTTHTLLGISGALRKDATNRLLPRNAARLYDGADYTEADVALPLFDEDIQNRTGLPAAVQALADQIARADAVLISTPEYNKALSGVLKNALDWVSRVEGNPWLDKPVVLMASASGRAGGERALSSLVLAMLPFRPRLVHGPEVLVASARGQFDETGTLNNPRYEKALGQLMERLRAAVAG